MCQYIYVSNSMHSIIPLVVKEKNDGNKERRKEERRWDERRELYLILEFGSNV